jgi:hypothetical protein
MRYLFTQDATKKYGGQQFTPVTRVSGQLFGTLALESGADAVLKAGGRWVREITKEDFDKYEARRGDFAKSKTEFRMADRTQEVLPKVAPKVATSVSDVLKPKPLK